MKLYLIHIGFYEPKLLEGIYEQHGNILIAAKNTKDAKNKIKKKKIYIDKKMHIDGILEINTVDGYKINLYKNNK